MRKFHWMHVVIGGDCVCIFWFLQLNCAWSLLSFLFSLQSLCYALSSGVNYNATARGLLLPSPSLAGSQTWVFSTTRGRMLTFGGQPLLPHSMGREQGCGHLRTNPGFGVFWFIPLFLVVAYLPPISFIERIFSGLSEEGLACVQTG